MSEPLTWSDIYAMDDATLNEALATACGLRLTSLLPTDDWGVLMPLARQAGVSQIPEDHPRDAHGSPLAGWRYAVYVPDGLLYQTLWVPYSVSEEGHRLAVARLALWGNRCGKGEGERRIETS